MPDAPSAAEKKPAPLSYSDPLFIAACVAAVFGDLIMLAMLILGVALLPLAGIGLAPLALGILIREAIAIALFGYVAGHMKSPRSLMKDIVSTVEAPEIGWALLVFRPWVLMLIAVLAFFLPLLTIALFLAILANNTLVNKLIAVAQKATIPPGAGALAQIGATAQTVLREDSETTGESRGVLRSATANVSQKITTTQGDLTRPAEAGSSESRSPRRAVTEADFGMPEENPLIAARRTEFEAPVTQSEFDEARKKKAEEETFAAKDAALEERMNTGTAELRRLKQSLEEVPMAATPPAEEEGDEVVDLRNDKTAA